MINCKILIAEDEVPAAKVLGLKLQSSGYEVVLAHDGEEAFRLIQSTKFDLIILDLIMPKHDGFWVLEQLKKINSVTPVIVLSNLSQEEDLIKAKNLGAKDYFIKSDIPLAEVVKKVEAALLLG